QGECAAGAAVRRPAAARRDRPRAGDAAGDHAVRRGHLGAGSRAGRRRAGGDAPAGGGGHDHGGRDPRDGVRPPGRRPHRGLRERRHHRGRQAQRGAAQSPACIDPALPQQPAEGRRRVTRLGFVYPGGGAEHDYYRFAEANGFTVFLAGSRIPAGDDHDVEALRETARTEHIVAAALRLAAPRLYAVLWGCASGSFILGPAGAAAQARALAAATGLPATSTSLAFVAALRRLGARRVAVLATYPEPASRAFASFLGEHGIAVDKLCWLDAP